jgi:UDP-3-O-acyl N-acetylglucosamine deacetylase
VPTTSAPAANGAAETKTGRAQRTLARPARYAGIGIHTGVRSEVTVRPAEPNSGLVFVRTDLPGAPSLRVSPQFAHYDAEHGRRTILKSGALEVHTMEHLLASLAGLGIDNAVIELAALEVPEPEDGSARAIVEALLAAGLAEQPVARRHIKVTRPVVLQSGSVELVAIPSDRLRLTFTIDYDNPVVGTQHLSLDITDGVFERELAAARTFVLERDVALLRAQGLIQGGTLQSALVVGTAACSTKSRSASRTSSCATRCSTCSATWPCWAGRCSGTSSRCAPGTPPTWPSSTSWPRRSRRAAGAPTAPPRSGTSRPSWTSCRTATRCSWSTASSTSRRASGWSASRT